MHEPWSRRERQIMEILWRRGRATVQEVMEAMPSAPGYSGVRAMLRLLEQKGHLKHTKEGRRYIYVPVVSPTRARRRALDRLLQTFFDNSAEQAVASLLELRSDELSEEDFEHLSDLIEKARKEQKS